MRGSCAASGPWARNWRRYEGRLKCEVNCCQCRTIARHGAMRWVCLSRECAAALCVHWRVLDHIEVRLDGHGGVVLLGMLSHALDAPSMKPVLPGKGTPVCMLDYQSGLREELRASLRMPQQTQPPNQKHPVVPRHPKCTTSERKPPARRWCNTTTGSQVRASRRTLRPLSAREELRPGAEAVRD